MKQITCSVIDKPPPKWNFWKKTVDRQKFFDFNQEFPDNTYFCDSILSDKNNEELIIINNRIGSPSADAEVYSITYKGLKFAMKIMPRIDNDSEIRNQNEILTATNASKYPEYFPLTFAYGYCPDASYFVSENEQRSSFIPKAIEYSIVNKMSNILIGNNKKRFLYDYKNGLDVKKLERKYEGSKIEQNETIQADFLISELANGDLGNWSMSEHDISEWKTVITDVFIGTYYLTVMLEKVHPDLHFGNVLIVNSDSNIKALIHDFGRCYDVSPDIPATYKASLLSFCGEFIACSNRNDLIIPRRILIVIQDIYNIVEKTDINLNNIQEIYENILFPIIANI